MARACVQNQKVPVIHQTRRASGGIMAERGVGDNEDVDDEVVDNGNMDDEGVNDEGVD